MRPVPPVSPRRAGGGRTKKPLDFPPDHQSYSVTYDSMASVSSLASTHAGAGGAGGHATFLDPLSGLGESGLGPASARRASPGGGRGAARFNGGGGYYGGEHGESPRLGSDISYRHDRPGHGILPRRGDKPRAAGSAGGDAGADGGASWAPSSVGGGGGGSIPPSRVPLSTRFEEASVIAPHDGGAGGASLSHYDHRYDTASGEWRTVAFPALKPASRRDVMLLERWLTEQLAKVKVLLLCDEFEVGNRETNGLERAPQFLVERRAPPLHTSQGAMGSRIESVRQETLHPRRRRQIGRLRRVCGRLGEPSHARCPA